MPDSLFRPLAFPTVFAIARGTPSWDATRTAVGQR